MINLRDSGNKRVRKIQDVDPLHELRVAVTNGQTRAALDYAVRVIGDLDQELRDLRSEVEALKNVESVEEEVSVPPKPAPRRSKPAAKKTPEPVSEEVVESESVE